MKLKQTANIIYEATVVKRLKRTGWQILGDNEESVGEHSFMTCVIAWFLAKEMKLNVEKVLLMGLFHDFHESRTGDIDKINKLYVTRNEGKANKDIFATANVGIYKTLVEYEARKTKEAQVVYEANIIALLVELKQLEENGNYHVREWIEKNAVRIHSSESLALVKELLSGNTQMWWQNLRKRIAKGFLQEK